METMTLPRPAVTDTRRRSRKTVPPERLLSQRLEALERANRVRTDRARLKREITAGRRLLDERLLREPPLQTMKLFDLLRTLPKIGRVKANRLLITCRISPSKSVGGLSERQRTEILLAVRTRRW